MRPQLTIRNVLAVFFLLLFAFCITPKRTLHNLVANHKDSRVNSRLQDKEQTQVSKAGFHCQVDNLIIESPFVADANTLSFQSNPVFFLYDESTVPSIHSSAFFCYGLRGPPTC